ncbi:FH protein interacting protein FIP2 [Diplonema papillatum]|nr:FH protein interacting protein FIP2 [Diplonema papillatum]|eukprot:gene11446-17611_t
MPTSGRRNRPAPPSGGYASQLERRRKLHGSESDKVGTRQLVQVMDERPPQGDRWHPGCARSMGFDQHISSGADGAPLALSPEWSAGVIELNVGGTTAVTTCVTTLERYPDSQLAGIASGRSCFQRDRHGRPLIDRPVAPFLAILDWLRSGQLALPAGCSPHLLRNELSHFGLLKHAPQLFMQQLASLGPTDNSAFLPALQHGQTCATAAPKREMPVVPASTADHSSHSARATSEVASDRIATTHPGFSQSDAPSFQHGAPPEPTASVAGFPRGSVGSGKLAMLEDLVWARSASNAPAVTWSSEPRPSGGGGPRGGDDACVWDLGAVRSRGFGSEPGSLHSCREADTDGETSACGMPPAPPPSELSARQTRSLSPALLPDPVRVAGGSGGAVSVPFSFGSHGARPPIGANARGTSSSPWSACSTCLDSHSQPAVAKPLGSEGTRRPLSANQFSGLSHRSVSAVCDAEALSTLPMPGNGRTPGVLVAAPTQRGKRSLSPRQKDSQPSTSPPRKLTKGWSWDGSCSCYFSENHTVAVPKVGDLLLVPVVTQCISPSTASTITVSVSGIQAGLDFHVGVCDLTQRPKPASLLPSAGGIGCNLKQPGTSCVDFTAVLEVSWPASRAGGGLLKIYCSPAPLRASAAQWAVRPVAQFPLQESGHWRFAVMSPAGVRLRIKPKRS